jgi:hypothetical protein
LRIRRYIGSVKDERQRQSGGRNGAIGEGCGHFLPSECPDELAAAILAFLARDPDRHDRALTLATGGPILTGLVELAPYHDAVVMECP